MNAPMDQKHLQSLLRELHAELRAAGPADPENRELIERLARDIEATLAPSARPGGEYHGLRDRLTDAATAFEAAHPRLGKAVENVIDTLVRYNL